MQGMAKLTLTMILATAITGCVTEQTYSGTDVQVKERKFDPVAAAKERIQLGLTYLQKGNSEQAKFNLDKAQVYAPNLEEVHIAMAYYYQTVGDDPRAVIAYEDAIKSSSASGDAFNNFGVYLCQQGQYRQAEKRFLQAIEQPEYTRAAASYENLGLCSQEAGELDKARDYFIAALKYEPRRRTSLLALVEIALQQDNYSQAKQSLKQFQRVAADTPQSLELGIRIELGLNDPEAAKRYGIQLLATFPSSNQAKEYRASLHQ
ncbi:type IV pilus biogenesis/stability protein PilW [Shewanella sp. NIFS-20-20]|uniref:type IV pilus biogenesis/stability protein PilW n=1 Tax=Shewanella sp. NIFS-20-20 TaxID=2853806 RepID=UPI001C47D8CD|nr:type IV pilus biogenesis/stability protein PilW [Shewanella sp. NIFS-20-20]MBV7317121.1 type IV pilus biogenesis/stability protein PilW [Shewanella sp. NIFS-20-20]